MKIVQDGEHEALRTDSEPVPKELFGTVELKKIIQDMQRTLAREHDGVAIAAPQIGIPLQIFVVSPQIDVGEGSHRIYINPTIVKASKEKKRMQEGCLSLRWLYGEVLRHTRLTVRAQDEYGQYFERGASGLLAHIFQHEIDHFHSTLFIDKAAYVSRLSEAEIQELESKNEKN